MERPTLLFRWKHHILPTGKRLLEVSLFTLSLSWPPADTVIRQSLRRLIARPTGTVFFINTVPSESWRPPRAARPHGQEGEFLRHPVIQFSKNERKTETNPVDRFRFIPSLIHEHLGGFFSKKSKKVWKFFFEDFLDLFEAV